MILSLLREKKRTTHMVSEGIIVQSVTKVKKDVLCMKRFESTRGG